MSCEDFPCCGHGPPPMGDGGGCPVVDEEGNYRFVCVGGCGELLPTNNRSAICAGCHDARRQEEDEQGYYAQDEREW